MMDKGLDLIIVDYLGLMHADGKTENRQLEVSEISRQLKAIALELKVPLIACAQLSRASTTREQAPRAVRPARLRLHRAGRGRRHVHPPRGVLRPRNGGQERG